MRFDWHPRKAVENVQKHQVYFEEACTIFTDRSVLTMHDDQHSAQEDRWVSLGLSSKGRLLIVIHTWPEPDDSGEGMIRIISARRTNRREQNHYTGSTR